MPTVPFLGGYGDLGGSGLMFRNKLINGGFDIWQRGTSQTSASYGSDDRWYNDHSGSSKTVSRQTFTLGQTDVSGNPKYFSRTVVTSVAGAANYVYKYQNIESVLNFAGQTATLSFWAKADAAKNIAVDVRQNFGSGGSPSSAVSVQVTTCALTTSWQRFTVAMTFPSISGKVLGTDNNDAVNVAFWFDAGSNFNSRTNSLGNQSGTFDIANVQLEAGPVATPFEQRPIGTELALCQRYYYRITGGPIATGLSYATSAANFLIQFPVPMRVPVATIETTGTSANYNVNYLTTATNLTSGPTLDLNSTTNQYNARIEAGTSAVMTVGQFVFLRASATAYIGFIAEL